MLQSVRSENITKSALQPLETGQIKESLNASGLLEERDCTSNHSLNQSLEFQKHQNLNQQEEKSSTPECLHSTKKQTSKDRSKTSSSTTQTTLSSGTSEVVSTGKDKDCYPFWNNATKELSQKLLLHIKTGFVDSDWSCWNGYSRSIKSGLPFIASWKQPKLKQTSLPRTYWQSRTSLWREITDRELQKRRENAKKRNKGQKKDYKPKEEPLFKCQKHKLIPNQPQSKLFKRWFGVYRWTYNKCCDLLKNRIIKHVPTWKEIRELIVNIKTIKEQFSNEQDWILEVPYDIRDKAAREFVKNLKTQVKLGKSLNDFELHYKSKKTDQALEIDVKHWHQGSPFTSVWKKEKLEPIRFHNKRKKYSYTIKNPKTAVRLISSLKCSKFLLCTPSSVEDGVVKVCDNQTDSDYKVVFIDPGVRTFITGYDSDGRIIEFGVGYEKILGLCQRLDRLVSVASKAKHRTRYHLKNRVLPRIRKKIKSIVSDLHWKVAKFLCNNYSDIHLPLFETSRMVKKSPVRRLNSKTARMMCTWSHYKFEQALRYRCRVTGSRLFTANEAYTSRTCCLCGNLNPKYSSKTFRCNSCGLCIDRDINGAICICLRQCTVELKKDT